MTPGEAVAACEAAGTHAKMRTDPMAHRQGVARRRRWTDLGAMIGECCSCHDTIVLPLDLEPDPQPPPPKDP